MTQNDSVAPLASSPLWHKVLTAGLALIVVPIALAASWGVAILVAGPNSSDVGVPSYAHPELTQALGWLVYSVLGLGLLWAAGRIAGRDRTIAYAVGLVAFGIGFLLNRVVLAWLAG